MSYFVLFVSFVVRKNFDVQEEAKRNPKSTNWAVMLREAG